MKYVGNSSHGIYKYEENYEFDLEELLEVNK